MSKPFADLHKETIDEQIEQSLHTIPEQQNNEDARCLQDLHYLYRKEEILARVQQRVMGNNQPATPSITQPGAASMAWQEHNTLVSRPYSPRKKPTWPQIAASLAAAVLLIGAIIGTTQFLHAPSQPAPGADHKGSHATATATPADKIVFSDPLSQNIHQWPAGSTNGGLFVFKDGAYHITNQSNHGVLALGQQDFTQARLSYQITMEQIGGDLADPTNTYGVILCYSSRQANGQTVQTFYSFEILNNNSQSEYRFYKYDSRQKAPWSTLWHTRSGKEFHGGKGQQAINTVKVQMDGPAFTFFVNGQQVGSIQDSAFASGRVGMIVNLNGSEVAFSNLLIARP